MQRPSRTFTGTSLLISGLLFALLRIFSIVFHSSALRTLSKLALACLVLIALTWAFRILWRRFFWRVGRRLAFSYIAVGVLPMAMLALIFLLAAYLFGGFLLGHLYRDALDDLDDELTAASHTRLSDVLHERPGLSDRVEKLAFAEYRKGKRFSGDAEAPELWPTWLEAPAESTPVAARHPFVGLANGRVSAAAVARSGDRGVLVYFAGDLDAELRQRTHVWLELLRDDDPRRKSTTRLQIFGFDLRLGGLWLKRTPEQSAEYYKLNPPATPGAPRFLEKPTILWMESTGALPALASGTPVSASVAASLASSPPSLFRAMLSTSAEVDSAAWLALLGVAVLFAEIYLVAAGIAIFMIFGLSRAVNRLSKATDAIGRGNFGTRIPVRRKDQLGDLQRSFNSMSDHLEELIQTAAQKEVLDKELGLARQVQQDLLPAAIDERPGTEFAAFFEPSAAIGGDYFDILNAGGGRVAVVVADVAGHGLAAGLRMALVKSAITLLVEDGIAAPAILTRLHRLLRNKPGERSFVTASLSIFDPATGDLDLTNAGHPPAYVVRLSGEVEELLVPGVPLGAMGMVNAAAGSGGSGGLAGASAGTVGTGAIGVAGAVTARLAAGEAIVWLSDGLIECCNAAGEQFGYDRIRQSLVGAPTTASAIRDRLLEAIRQHTGGLPAEDDRTLVVMVYRAGGFAVDGASPR
ncbi:MAG: SpoIIE family protein phosphatase [Thermoanaerobaculia bacterium]